MSGCWVMAGAGVLCLGTGAGMWLACGPGAALLVAFGPSVFVGALMGFAPRIPAGRHRRQPGITWPGTWTEQDDVILSGNLSLTAWEQAGQSRREGRR